jgi:hypothetical protein
MLEKWSRPLHDKFREAFNLSHIRDEGFFDDFQARMINCSEETEAIRGSLNMEIVLPVVQDEHMLAAGGGILIGFHFLFWRKGVGKSLLMSNVDDWYKCDLWWFSVICYNMRCAGPRVTSRAMPEYALVWDSII